MKIFGVSTAVILSFAVGMCVAYEHRRNVVLRNRVDELGRKNDAANLLISYMHRNGEFSKYSETYIIDTLTQCQI